MKLAVLGGTFNPLHNAHVMLAETVCKKLGYDRVLFVPAFIPPHKQINSNVTAENRLEMVLNFCEAEGSGRFFCEPCEINRGGVSYTCDTLEYICQKYKAELTEKPAFILGEESAAEFYKWKNPERIVQLANLIIAVRKPGKSNVVFDSDNEMANKPSGAFTGDFSECFNAEKFGYPFIALQNPEMKISSSEIRTLILKKQDWEKLVPASVCRYIKEKKLYDGE